jgi:hypothetical protein
LFLPIVPFISILLAPFRGVQATDCLCISLAHRPLRGRRTDAGFRWCGLRAYPADCFWVRRWCQMKVSSVP